MLKVQEIVYVVYGVSDPDRTQAFMQDFGLLPVPAPGAARYLRGRGPNPYIYIAEPAQEPSLRAIGLRLASAADLQLAAQIEGASPIRALDRPGGGHCVEVTLPGGIVFELVHGIAAAEPLPARAPLPVNHGLEKHRFNQPQRLERRSCEVLRLGHAAIVVPDATRARDWAMRHLGLIVSDAMTVPGAPGQYIGFFMRCDLGATPADHHSFLIANADGPGVHHVSFELQDIDAVYMGHEWLKRCGRSHHWGVGRHVLGSQVFDYWWDPDGFRMEHYADGDLFDNQVAATEVEGTNEQLWTWGPHVPETFFQQTRGA